MPHTHKPKQGVRPYQGLFSTYETLVSGADRAFQRMVARYPACIPCTRRCSDCCHAVFGLFVIEAAYLQERFMKLARKTRRAATLRGKKAQNQILSLQKSLQGAAPLKETVDPLSLARLRCPLLDDRGTCMLYPDRPITCRVYGIPTLIKGKVRVCGKTGFEAGRSYPVFNLDKINAELYRLSRAFLGSLPKADPGKADLILSVSTVLETPIEKIVEDSFS